jgi:hypothetical protein
VCEGTEIPNTAPEFAGEISATPNPTSSNLPVTIEVPVSDSNGDDVTVKLSFNGEDLGATFDQNSKTVAGGSGTATFTMTPELFRSGSVYVQVDLEDEHGEVHNGGRELGIGIE